ncbi:hypothetical protein U1Q18_044971 [Sarracenia purpurea var. burkii]
MKHEEDISSSPSSPARVLYSRDTDTDTDTDHRKSKPAESSPFRRLCQKILSPARRKGKRHYHDSLSPEVVARCSNEVQMVFRYLDENGDGKISAAELQRSVRAVGGELSREEARLAVESLDEDGDGLLGFEEFGKLMEEDEEEEEEERDEELRQAFGMYEMGGSGCITPTSLKKMLSRLGESTTIKDCKAMIRKFDLDGDGVLNFDEFKIMMC